MTLPIYPSLNGLSYIFRGNPFNKATSVSGIQTRGLQRAFRGNPFVVNQNFLITIDLTFESSFSLITSLELDIVSLEFQNTPVFDVDIKFEGLIDFVFESSLSLEIAFDLEFPSLVFSSDPELLVSYDLITPLPESVDLIFTDSMELESDIDYSIVVSLDFGTNGELQTSVDLLIPNFYEFGFANGLEIELDLMCLSHLYGDSEYSFSILNSMTSDVLKSFQLRNNLLILNEVEKNMIIFNRVDPSQSFFYEGFYFSKTHGV